MQANEEPIRIFLQDGGPLVRYFSVYLKDWVTQPPGEIPIREYAAMDPDDRKRLLVLCSVDTNKETKP